MRNGGCHTVILGVGSADDGRLVTYRKGYDTEEVRRAVARVKAAGMRVVGTFLVGLPEDTEESSDRTLEFALELDLDFLSLNVAVPRFGTPFRARAIELGLCTREDLVMDQSGSEAFLPTLTLDRGAIERLKRRMVRRFYLRPELPGEAPRLHGKPGGAGSPGDRGRGAPPCGRVTRGDRGYHPRLARTPQATRTRCPPTRRGAHRMTDATENGRRPVRSRRPRGSSWPSNDTAPVRRPWSSLR